MSRPPASTVPTSPDGPSPDAPRSFPIVLLGGGEAGRSLLDALDEAGRADRILLIEPSSNYYYQPDWMRVGTGDLPKEQTQFAMADRVPDATTWLQESVTAIDAEQRLLTTDRGTVVAYDYLVVALGTTPNWDRVRGLEGHLGTHGICSVYGYGHAEQAWEMIQSFSGGRALFTAPSRPHKGGPAPLTILRRAESVWRDTGVHDQTDLFFVTASSPTFAGDAYSELIERESHEETVHVYSGYDLIDVRPERREAVFSVSKGQSQSKDVLPYDLLHVVPPMRPPALLAESDLALQDGPLRGYLPVDPDTFRHPRFDRIFGVGDAIGIEGVKTGERARAQAERLAQTLLEIRELSGGA
jgi:sulfide:quinone oxidoreductase